MPPPVTPSPHRFISGRQRRSEAQDEDRRPSVQVNKPEVDPDLRPQPASMKQFAQKPHFTAVTLKPAVPSGSQRPNLAQALKPSTQRREDVEEASSPSVASQEELLTADEYPNVLPSIETRSQAANVDPRPPKRDHDTMTAYPAFRHPQTPASHTKPVPKFTSGQTIDHGETSNRPAFLRSSTGHTGEPVDPLPEAFSPHRRSQKYLPGGAAAMVQQWVLEIGQEMTQSRRAQAMMRGDECVLQARIDELRGDGPWTATASVDGGPDLMLLLTGDGTPVEGLRTGCTVGARIPTWEIELEGQKWTVVVDWKVIG